MPETSAILWILSKKHLVRIVLFKFSNFSKENIWCSWDTSWGPQDFFKFGQKQNTKGLKNPLKFFQKVRGAPKVLSRDIQDSFTPRTPEIHSNFFRTKSQGASAILSIFSKKKNKDLQDFFRFCQEQNNKRQHRRLNFFQN